MQVPFSGERPGNRKAFQPGITGIPGGGLMDNYFLKHMAMALGCVLFVNLSNYSEAKIISRDVEYREGDAVLQGYISYDSMKGKRPGVLIVHEWNGLGDYVKRRAREIAGLGYYAFCADIYGKGIRPAGPDESAKQAGIYMSDRKLLRRRVIAGIDELKKQDMVDDKKIAAMGYCFGGTSVLELARSGSDVAGVVSFHGNLANPEPQDANNIKTKVLVLHGANDPVTPPDKFDSFLREMKESGSDWQLIIYANAVHGFTNPANGNDPTKGVAYNEKADKRSWLAMKQFFREIFSK